MAQARAVTQTTAAALDTWAAQKRRLLLGREESVACTLGRLKTERVAAGEGSPGAKQHWPEVYTGDGLVVQLIVGSLTEMPRITLTFYYVLRWPWRVPISAQAREIGVPPRTYWTHLQAAEAAVEVALRVLETLKSCASVETTGVSRAKTC